MNLKKIKDALEELRISAEDLVTLVEACCVIRREAAAILAENNVPVAECQAIVDRALAKDSAEPDFVGPRPALRRFLLEKV